MLDAAHAVEDDVVRLRRELHQDPELGLLLPRTQARILDALTGLGMEVSSGDSCSSVVADLDTGRPGPTVLLRADMDALPLSEDNDDEFSSQVEGAMHACGHDTHVAMLVGAARLLSEQRSALSGTIRFMFQPGEEGFHGARHMIEEGVLDGVDRAFALHVFTNLPAGVVATRSGPIMGSGDSFRIEVEGKGGHASAPHRCVDPIPAAAAIVTGLHAMVGRVVDPTNSGLVTVAHLNSGTTGNVIPPNAFMEGTIRTLDTETRSDLVAAVERVASGIASGYGCTARTEITPGYPVTSNDVGYARRVEQVTKNVLGESMFVEMPRPIMGTEDFSYVLQRVPGAMAFLGVCPEGVDPNEAAPNHSNLMQVNEKSLTHGVAVYAAMAMAGM